MEEKRPLILVTNDDGIEAKGIQSLVEMVKPYGDIIVVAPFRAHSGMSHAITVTVPVRYKKLKEADNVAVYGCTGTPVDCVKLAFSEILPKKPDLLVSGINHGSNASVSIIYSGTMAAVIEGCVNDIPSIGFSLLDFDSNADFDPSVHFGRKIVEHALVRGLPEHTCLNVNIPAVKREQIRGIKVCRQAKGVWKEEFEKRMDPRRGEYFWLTGYFENHENGAKDTDEWALHNNYISVVPVHIDLTNYKALKGLEDLNHD
ncbi:MAG: 5'/3'-nucleotidase SurE [Bacteroidales bacterium]